MIKTLLSTSLLMIAITNTSFGQVVIYDIPIDSAVGLELTSGDICTAPFTTEEAKQMAVGNSWGGTWTSTNSGTATLIEVELMFSFSDSVSSHPTTLNGTASNNINPGPAVNCAVGGTLTWNIDPANYNSLASNTLLVDYTASTIINQVDNLPYVGDPYLRVSVTYTPSQSGINELTGAPIELLMIVDLMGRETTFVANTPLIYIYSDGSTERVFSIE